ncbi:UNVERIFIED_CONTAM: hypothetical protein FKN15_011560 [Acipenser sinensis]
MHVTKLVNPDVKGLVWICRAPDQLRSSRFSCPIHRSAKTNAALLVAASQGRQLGTTRIRTSKLLIA